MEILIYPKCSTCQKAVKWLNQNEIKFETRHIVDQPLSKEEVKKLHELSNEDIKKFFNTSGLKYRELNLKEKFKELSLEQCYELLASDGMLVKRPLAYTDSKITIGFNEVKYEDAWKN